MSAKVKKLQKILKGMKRVLVAYSGGVDSTFLLKVALDALGRENVLAVIAMSGSFPIREFTCAKKTAREIGCRYMVITTNELDSKSYKKNPINRCYYCKKELFSKLLAIAREKGLKYVLDGTNFDDLKDMRYGAMASKELNIKSPLLAAGIGKKDIRRFSRALGLDTWDKPSFACLSSRFPYGTAITKRKLRVVERAEDFLKDLGFRQVRVRFHGKIARIELYRNDIKKIFQEDIRTAVDNRLKQLGFDYVAVDLRGYRTGSMNEPVIKSRRKSCVNI